ncbi:MAG: extracellular solute-binding protein [Alphaproteobacteria bacterium]|nr:extracellular solute-binding protein [Alphaproteobacteria bacterium]
MWLRSTAAVAAALGVVCGIGTVAAETAGERAANAAKEKYSGVTLALHSEAGLQEIGWELYNSRKWKELTGITVTQTSAPTNEMFVTTVQDFKGPGSFDVLDVAPAYMPDLAEMGAIVPLDDWMAQYGYQEDYDDIAAAYKGWGEYKGKIWGFPDDGDVHVMLYRKDVLEDPANKDEFKAKYGYDLAAPKDWKQWDDISQFITDKFAPDMYGSANARQKGITLYYWMDMFRDYGGRFFDENATCTWNSEAGVKSLTDYVNQRRYMPPGVDAWGFVEAGAAFLSGTTVLHYTWPGVGRWVQNIGTDIEAMNWVPPSKVEGKVGYAVPPGGSPELAVGWLISVSGKSSNQEAAYLFAQWSNSKEVSLGKTSLGYSIRDPFRVSHYSAENFRNLWSNAGEYLDALKAGGENGVQDLTVVQAQKYHDLIENAIQAAIGGQDAKTALDESCAAAEKVTDQIGRDKQKDAVAQFSAKANAYR